VYIKKFMSLKPNQKERNIILNILKRGQFEFLPRAPFYIDMPLIIEKLYFLCGPCKVVIKKSSVEKEFREARYELGSRGIELSWQLQNNGKKGIRRCREHFMYYLK
jgi:hypothetical protein